MNRLQAIAECRSLLRRHGLTVDDLASAPAPQPVPLGYKFKRGPGYQFDPRYQCDPDQVITGGFLEEFRSRCDSPVRGDR